MMYFFPGTTWLQEIVYLIHSDFDMNGAQKRLIDDRFPYFEFMYPGAKAVASLPSPRLIKSHLPLNLLPSDIQEKKPKVYVGIFFFFYFFFGGGGGFGGRRGALFCLFFVYLNSLTVM